jgi:beta-glucosidase
MTLAEKIGQMTQVESGSITPDEVTAYRIGSVLTGGSGAAQPNTPEGWLKRSTAYQDAALQTRLGIPLIYGVDAVHGLGGLVGATLFPQNIGLGAANDPDLMRRIGRATAVETAATGVRWNFAPVVAVAQDIRWGRTYESYGENPALVSALAVPYLEGLQSASGAEAFDAPSTVLATPKHFLADGGTAWGTSTTVNIGKPYLLDQGDAQIDEATLRRVHLAPYQAVVDAGAQSIMASFSSWNGVKMHGNAGLLTGVLKDELGFDGFVVSDWQGIDQIPGNYYSDVVTSVNAGIDMVMVPYDFTTFIETLTQAVEAGDVPMARIDDAVRRILQVKAAMGLFDQPFADKAGLDSIGSGAHRQLAREAVRKSLVLLKNDAPKPGGDPALPLAKDAPLIFVAGEAADDIGIQSGGWTIEWQGKAGDITKGTTILEGIKETVSPDTKVVYDRLGKFGRIKDTADIGIAVVGEQPYAEGVGDVVDLSLSEPDVAAIRALRERAETVVVVLLSGRPLVIAGQLALADAWVAAWLPGTEGAGVADVLFGDAPSTGKLPFTWPRSVDQLPFDFAALPSDGPGAPLFPAGFGLSTGQESGMKAVPMTSLIPMPVSVEPTGDTFFLTGDTPVVVDAGSSELAAIGATLAHWLGAAVGTGVPVLATGSAPPGGAIRLTTAGAGAALGHEGYELAVTPGGVTIAANRPAGVFYGVQTLRQLLPPAFERSVSQPAPWPIPTAVIRDTPRFAWRGLMLDVARHFFAVDDVKRIVDLMAAYKLNRLHLHLTDDQGWRLMIVSWPRLAEFGGRTAVGDDPGGFYTQAEYADLVQYARSRYVDVVPEIDMPGHTNAALASYAELNCDGQAPSPYTGMKVGFSSLCAGKEITYTFVDDVIREVAALTPGPYLHVGGDEALSTSDADYQAFMARVQAIVLAHGKQMLGWEEVACIELAPGSVVQHWHNEMAKCAAGQGVKIIMSPAGHAYLDMKYDDTTALGQDWAGTVDVEKAYAWDPATVRPGITEDAILGVESALWTETVRTMDDLEFLVFPRLLGHAEIGWSPAAGRSWDAYRQRLAGHGPRLEAMHVNFYRQWQD